MRKFTLGALMLLTASPLMAAAHTPAVRAQSIDQLAQPLPLCSRSAVLLCKEEASRA